nr:F420-dependent glucose-6-phosphate dehydrogenase [uncultured bacterium]
MKSGFVIPQIGPLAAPDNIIRVARRAEGLAYDGLWVTERLLYPVKPQNPYPGTPDGHLPEPFKQSLDPLEALTFAAAHTGKIGLGTSVLDIPYYNPVMFARRVTTLDVLSAGRLRLGLGLGWSIDEYQASGAVTKDKGAYADEFLEALKTIWTTDPAEFQGRFFNLPKSYIQPKPVQKPHPAIYLAAYAPAALARVGRVADGWNPAGVPVAGMAAMMDQVRQAAQAAGRDPSSLKLIVRANLYITEHPISKDRFIFTGTLSQIKEDVEACRGIKADEVFFDAMFSNHGNSIARLMEWMEQLRALV